MPDLTYLLDSLGIGQSGSDHTTLMELMNFTLHCLGGIRIMVIAAEKEKAAAEAAKFLKIKELETPPDVALRQIFTNAVTTMLSSISSAAPLDELDPAKHLVESYPDLNKIGNSQWMSIHWALLGDDCFGDRITMIDTIVKAHGEVVDELDREGRSILHYASRLSSVSLVKFIMKYSRSPGGFGPNERNLNGAFPLHNAARFSRSLSVVECISDLDPSIIFEGNNGGTLPLHWAAAKNTNLDIINFLMTANPEASNTANHDGYLPLHSAGQNVQLQIVKAVHDSNPSAISVCDSDGGVPLHHACCFNSNIEVIKFMYFSYPKGITIVQADGITPLHLAASKNPSVDVMKFLLEKHPQAAFQVDNDGWLPLHCIVDRDRNEMTSDRLICLRLLLLANPAAVSTSRKDGQTAFQMAKTNDNSDSLLRLMLFSQPEYDKVEFARLNWGSYRRLIVLACLSFHNNTVIDDGNDGTDKESDKESDQGESSEERLIIRDEEIGSIENLLEDDFVYIVKRLCNWNGFTGQTINSNILRHIIKFL
mmetsp:Transcript_34622/g.32985  ORF Transcript_34622/g.32985 Transcript_34622/m.32985 type:complete len:537 (-) Transcript_34622:447-2057(-)